jgi:hypothetical protein
MMDEKNRELLAGYVDGELTASEKLDFERELSHSAELRAELHEFMQLKEVTSTMRYADIPDEVWDSYWESLYKKTERGVGWIFFSVGAIMVIAFGLYHAFHQLLTDPNAPLWLKVGLPMATLGAAILLVSYIRERLFARKRERYTEVEK